MAGRNLVEIKIPYVDAGVSESRISKIHKTVGGIVFQGEVVAEAENSMFVFDIKSTSTGVIDKICKNVGDVVATDDTFALLSVGCNPDILERRSLEAEQHKKSRMIGSVMDTLKGLFSRGHGDGSTTENASHEEALDSARNREPPEDSEFPDDTDSETPDKSEQTENTDKPNFNPDDFVSSESASALGLDDESYSDMFFKPEEKSDKNDSKQGNADSVDDDPIDDFDADISSDGQTLEEEVLSKLSKSKLESEVSNRIRANNDERIREANLRNQSEASKYADKQRLIQKVTELANNKLRSDKTVEQVFLSMTDKIDVSNALNVIQSDESKQSEDEIILPIFIKGIGYAMNKTSIFNKHVVNVTIEDSLFSRKAVVTNLVIKNISEIADSLLLEKSHVDGNILQVIVNKSSVLAEPLKDNIVIFNKLFNEGDRKYVYITVKVKNKQQSIFMKYLTDFIKNPGCIIFDNVV